jgi:hypothetical protein
MRAPEALPLPLVVLWLRMAAVSGKATPVFQTAVAADRLVRAERLDREGARSGSLALLPAEPWGTEGWPDPAARVEVVARPEAGAL